MIPQAATTTPPPSPLLERLRRASLGRGDSAATAETLVSWCRAFILFHNTRHPEQLGRGYASNRLRCVRAPLRGLRVAATRPDHPGVALPSADCGSRLIGQRIGRSPNAF